MTKRTVVLSSATGMLLTMFSSLIDAGIPYIDAGLPHIHESSSQTGIHAEFTVYETLLDVSGFAEQLSKVPDAVSSSIESTLLDDGTIELFEASDIPYLKKAVPAAFSAQTLYTAVIEQVEAQLSVDTAKQLVKFYSSPRGQQLREAETRNSILENADRFKHWHATQGLVSLSDERLLVLSELEQAMQATQGAVDAMIGMQVAMQVGLTPVLPANQQRSARDLLRSAQAQRPSLTRHYQQSSLETLSFVFQEQSMDELRHYCNLLNSEAGQHYVAAINNGLSRGLIRAAEKLGHSIQTLLSARMGQGV